MRFFNSLTILCVILYFASCNNINNKFTVSGSISQMPVQTVYLSEVGIDNIAVVDSAKSDEKGNFKLEGQAPEAGLYKLSFSTNMNRNFIFSVDQGNINIEGTWNEVEYSKVKGSASSESLSGFLQVLRNHMQDFNTYELIVDTFKARGNDSMVEVVTGDMLEMKYQLTQYVERYADTTKFLPNALFAVQCLNPQSEKEYLKAFVPKMNKRFPSAKLAKDFTAKVGAILNNQQPAQNTNHIAIGTAAPEIKLPSVDGKEVSLSSFKGKYVLVDFWASWCGPCRKENPNVVAAFNKFKDKNFTILGVSLDDDKEKWMKAIEKDGLVWNHISDLKGWESIAARVYNVQSIPANFLLDPNGVIIASDLRGEDLEKTLSELLK